MKEHPPFGTAPIRCTRNACPTCGCDSYSFMTVCEIKAWERKQRAQAHKES